MLNLKNQLLAGIMIAISFFVQGQNYNTYSPYSRYGIGIINTKGFALNKAMGGISQPIRNPLAINFLNPASYTAQDTMSFMLDFGLESAATSFESQGQTSTSGTGGFHHIAISFPVTKWWGAAAGIIPFSQVGYNIKHYETDPYILSSIGRVKYYHSGRGGINQAFMGSGFRPFKNFSLGVNLSYLFGSLDYINDIHFPTTGTINSPYYFNSTHKRSVVVTDFIVSVGAQYTAFLNSEKNKSFTFGATIDNEAKLNAKHKTLITYQNQTHFDTLQYTEDKKGTIDFPMNISAGVAYNHQNKLIAGIEYSQQDWSSAKFLGLSDSLTKNQTFRLGLQYTPNPNDLKSYLKRVHYRLGGHVSNTYLRLANELVNDYGISFGIGLPFRNNTRFNLSLELGQRGTTNNGLVKETYGVLNLSFTFYDFWFIKRKIN